MDAMGVFSSLIGDIPGDLSAIDHLAAQIHDQAEAVQLIGDEFRTTIRKTTIWTGRSREAFEESRIDNNIVSRACMRGLKQLHPILPDMRAKSQAPNTTSTIVCSLDW